MSDRESLHESLRAEGREIPQKRASARSGRTAPMTLEVQAGDCTVDLAGWVRQYVAAVVASEGLSIGRVARSAAPPRTQLPEAS